MVGMVTTYDGPGRARKPCPNGHYVHARSRVCACGHKFSEAEEKEVPVYDIGGKGRRKCNCGKFIGIRVQECPACGFDMTTLPKVEKPTEVRTFDEPGKGRKSCVCGKYVGARIAECPCGNTEFVKEIIANVKIEPKEEYVVEYEESDRPPTFRERLGFPTHRTTFIGAGNCPYKLDSSDEQVVLKWIEDVQKAFIAKGEVLAPSGFSYYATHYFDSFSPEYREIKRIITDYFLPFIN